MWRPHLLRVNDNRAFRYHRRAKPESAGVLGGPLLGKPGALVRSHLVLANGDRGAAFAIARKGVAHEAVHLLHQVSHLSLAGFQKIEEFLRAFARVCSSDAMHDSIPFL